MNQGFTFSTSNKIYLLIVAVLSFGLLFILPEKTPSQTGQYLGTASSMVLISALVAWIVWRLSGRKKPGASVTFNIVLTLMLLGHLGNMQVADVWNTHRAFQEMTRLDSQKEEFKDMVANTDDPEKIASAYNEYTDSVSASFDELAEDNAGKKKQFFAIMSDFLKESQAIQKEWGDSYTAVQDPSVLTHAVSILSQQTWPIGLTRRRQGVATPCLRDGKAAASSHGQ